MFVYICDVEIVERVRFVFCFRIGIICRGREKIKKWNLFRGSSKLGLEASIRM